MRQRTAGRSRSPPPRHSTGYVVGGKTFPSASVDEQDIRCVLEPEFDWDDGAIEACDLSADRTHGYTSIVLARVRRKSTDASAVGCGRPL